MDLARLERDCLFQLNVLLWAVTPQPASAPIRPVLLDAGYALAAIELPLLASGEERARLAQSSFQVNPNPVADVVLLNARSAICVLIECKPDSFTSQ